MRRAMLAGAAFLIGCGGDSTAPLERGQMPTGRYSYTVPSKAQFTGTLTLTYATPNSIAGTWAVPGYQPRSQRGGWHSDTYILYAMKVGSTDNSYTHNVHRTGDSYSCKVTGSEFVSTPCTLVYLGK
jgi:hypothetical protein